MRPAWIAVLGALFLCVPGALAAQEQPEVRENPEVTTLEFVGVESVDLDELKESISTTETECHGLLLIAFCWISTSPLFHEKHYLDREALVRDVLRVRVFYWKRGFREALVDTTVTPEGNDGEDVSVTFTVTEGPPTTLEAVRVRGLDSLLTSDEIARTVAMDTGGPFSLIELDSTFTLIRAALWDRGYSDATLDTNITVSREARTAEVEIIVDPRWLATVDRVYVTGNQRIADRTVLNSITLDDGDIYRRSEVIESQRNLYESALFKYARIVVPPQGDSTKLIEVSVVEGPLQEVRLSGGLSTVDFVQVEARYTNYNWFGAARRLSLRALVGNLLAPQLSGTVSYGSDNSLFRDVRAAVDGDPDPFLAPTWQLLAELRQPWFLSASNEIGASIFAHRQSAPAVYVDRGYGATATFTREVTYRLPLSLSYRFEITRTEANDVYYCVNFGVCQPATIDLLEGNQRLSPLSLTGSITRTNDLFFPSSGYRAQADLEYASSVTFSDFGYNRAFGDAALFISVSDNMVLAGHTRLGWVDALANSVSAPGTGTILHPRKRFYAGGSRSVRGFGENQLGPRVLTIAPSTLRGISIQSGDTTYNCDPAIPIRSCPVSGLADENFQPRPIGGNSLIEGSIELRFPIAGALTGAAFVDAALVGEGRLDDIVSGTGAITPGIGIRYQTDVGPIRVDLGYNPSISEDLTVYTQVREDGESELVALEQARTYAPGSGERGISAFLSRLTLHLSIGQAY